MASTKSHTRTPKKHVLLIRILIMKEISLPRKEIQSLRHLQGLPHATFKLAAWIG